MKSNQTILRSQATSNELQSWLDELESKRRDRNVSGGGAITPKNLPVSPRHVNMLKNNRPGSPYSRPGSNSHSPARISKLNKTGSISGNLTPTHENKNRRSSLAMRAKIADYSSPSKGGKRDLRKQMIQLENLVPSLKEREAELKKISQEIKLAPGPMKSPKSGSGTPKVAPTTPKRSPRNDYKNIRSRSPRNSESMSRVSTSQVSQEAIKLSSKLASSKQNNMDVDNSVVEQNSDSSDSSECGEFEDDFGNFSIQAPYDITPAQSRRQTTQHTPRKLQIKVNKKTKPDQTFLQQVVEKLEPSSSKQQPLPLSAPSFSATLMASSRNITPDRSTQVINQSSSMKIPTIKPLVPPTTSSVESCNSLTSMFSKKQSNTFTCDVCMVQVDKSAEQCASCETPNPSFKSTKPEPTKASFNFGSKPLEPKIDSTPVMDNTSLSALFKKSNAKKDIYTCSDCMCSNPITVESCPACEAANPHFTGSSSKSITVPKPAATFSFGQTTSTSLAPKPSDTEIPASSAPSLSSMFGQSSKSSKYTCDGCMCSNDISVENCPACETPNPKFTGTSSKPAEKTPAPTFSFGATAAAPASKPKEQTKKTPAFSFGATATASEPPKTTSLSSMFNSAASKSSKYTCDGCMCSNDVSVENCPACETPNPKFTGTSSNPAEKTPAPTFSFGAAAPAPKTASPAVAAPSFSFGGSPAVKPVEVAKPAPSFSFGAEKTAEEPSAKRKQAEPAQPVTGGFAFGKTASNESCQS